MKLAIMQPYFLPYIGYFQLMAAVDKFVVYDDVNFIKGGWINRNRILLNGREHLFTVPLAGASPNRLINQIKIAPGTGWKRKLTSTIEQAYRPAPHFEQIFPLLTVIINHAEQGLSNYVVHALEKVCGYLDITTTIAPNSAIYYNSELQGEARVLDICRQEKADIYINAPGGRALYNPQHFRQQNVELRFLESAPIEYQQFGPDFYPSLSIIDVLMFNSREEARKLVGQIALRP